MTVVVKSSSKKELRKNIHENKWGYGYVLKTSLILVAISMFINAYVVSAKGEQPIEANFAFRETLRDTRRAKTLSTYARSRGPMLVAKIEGWDPLASQGVTHLEDALGGFISGPLGLWKNNEVYAYEYTKEDDVTLVIESLKESKKHWTNGNADPCVDREIYIGGQKSPLQRDDTEFITVVIGFLTIKCDKTHQDYGYVTIVSSLTHGGPLLGRIYSVSADFKYSDHPVNVTLSTNKFNIKMVEVGAILEDRGYSSGAYYQTLAGIFFLPLLIWFMMMIRLSGVKVSVNMAIVSGGPSSASTASSASVASDSARSDVSGQDSEKEMKTNRKEVNATKHINPRIIELWKIPVLHILYIILYIFIEQIRRNDNDIIRTFITRFNSIHVDYYLHAFVLLGQELTSWLLSLYSTFSIEKKIGNNDNVHSFMHINTIMVIYVS